jgi:hypothetical protein
MSKLLEELVDQLLWMWSLIQIGELLRIWQLTRMKQTGKL